MKNALKNFQFPFTNSILVFSAVMIFFPIVLFSFLDNKQIINTGPQVFRIVFFVSTLFASLGFCYCTLAYHSRIVRGDELKLKIHLDSLNVAFTATLVSFFILVFVFINFAPTMLNWILVFMAVTAIIVYLTATQIIKDKYQ